MIAFANKIDSEEIISKTDAIKIGIIEKGKQKVKFSFGESEELSARHKLSYATSPRPRG